ncbi:MAG: outer membrane protein assembly factor BamA [Bacteroidetes bacterium]|nr:outer membrane protein assembly factor BamA [Bacteroidota bacterium]
MTFIKKYYLLSIVCCLLCIASFSQQLISSDSVIFNYAQPIEYEIGGVTISGSGTLDQNVLLSISGLIVGDKIKIPGDAISTAIKNLWKEGFFEDLKIISTKIQGKNIFLEIQVKERPRLSKFSFKGVKNHEADDLRDKLKLNRGKVVTENLLINSKNEVLDHFVKKGYLNAKVLVTQKKDSSLLNSVILFISVDKGKKVRIRQIDFHGNTELKDRKLRHLMKDTKQKKWYSIFTSAEFIESDFEKDKNKVVEKYQSHGYRDAKIIRDTVYKVSEDRLAIDIYVSEGKKYYFRNISWVGNSKYSSKDLDKVLSIKKGDIYNQSVLESRLFMNPNGTDISSLYMDDGYLFFQATPVEVLVETDSIDMEIRIYEGKQATINKVTVKGNTKTNDHVIMREIRTRPGQLFKRSDIIRSQRELSMLGYFNAEKLGVTPTPHPENGTVDIEYEVEEKSSDQLELSGGFGMNRVIGTLGVSFNNFSARNMFKSSAWQPLPSGDGQRLSIRAQSNGSYYQSFNMSFVEPWLGGKKPNSFSITPYYNIITNGRPKSDIGHGSLHIFGTSVGLGRRKKIPDDFFSEQWEMNYQYYALNNYQSVFAFTNGYANNINLKYTLSRNSVDDLTYPKSGSNITFSGQITPPWSYRPFSYIIGTQNLDYSEATTQDKYKWLEYYKLKFTSAWYTRLAGKLVLYTKLGYGFLGYYNKAVGLTPFERFYLGGSGLTGYNPLDGREIISLRGYDDGQVFSFQQPQNNPGAASILKYTMELRYPISLNPSATIYGLAFTEAGNSWGSIKEFNPFDVKRSAGVGLRFFLPMFGLLGFDYGWRFDDIPFKPSMQKSQFHFTIGYNLGEL